MLLAGGAWSSLFCRRHGIELPIGLVNATACRTTPAPEITTGALGTDFYCIRRRLDGGFTLALRGRGTVEAVARPVSLCADVLADLQAAPQGTEAVVRKVVLRPDPARHQLEPRQAFAVRGRARARPGARHVAGQFGARGADRVKSGTEGHRRSRKPGAARSIARPTPFR